MQHIVVVTPVCKRSKPICFRLGSQPTFHSFKTRPRLSVCLCTPTFTEQWGRRGVGFITKGEGFM